MSLVVASCQRGSPLELGTLSSLDRDSPFVLAAPHGEFDMHTADIVDKACESVSWDCLVVRGFRSLERPINVNRPSEGLTLASERITEDATTVYNAYRTRLKEIAGDSPKIYVEVHGNLRVKSSDRIEVAVVGFTREETGFFRSELEKALQANGLGSYHVMMQGDPKFFYGATSAKRFGVLKDMKRALHLEISKELCGKHWEATSRALGQFLQVVGATYSSGD